MLLQDYKWRNLCYIFTLFLILGRLRSFAGDRNGSFNTIYVLLTNGGNGDGEQFVLAYYLFHLKKASPIWPDFVLSYIPFFRKRIYITH